MRNLIIYLKSVLRPHFRVMVGFTLLAVVVAGLDALAPVAMGRSFDMAKTAGQSGPAVAWALGMLAAWYLLRMVADYLRMRIGQSGWNIAAIVSSAFIEREMLMLLDKPLAFHYGKKSSEVSEKVNKVRWDTENVIMGIVFDLWPALLAIAAILGYVTFLDWRIALALFASLAAYVVYTYRVIPHQTKLQRAWLDADHKLHGFGWDSVRNALVVKSTTNEATVAQRLADVNAEVIRARRVDNAFDTRIGIVQNAIIASGSFLALLVALLNFNAGRFSFGMVTTITAYTFAIFGYVRYCQWQFRSLIKLSTKLAEVQALDKEPAEDFASGAAADLRGEVEFRNIRFRYSEDKPTLEDVSFRVAAGMRVAIVGESGEGKTTLVDLLGRYYAPQGGQILMDGLDTTQINLRALRQQMAYVPQDLTLFHESLGFNIRYGRPDASEEDIQTAIRQAGLEAFVAALPEGLETVVGERGLKLSGGERQRVALARAFLRRPKIIVLDEPTAHLDSKTEEVVQSALATLMTGRTTFIIAHRLHTVQHADMILVLKDGRIVESGRHGELVALKGAYAALLKAQGGFIEPTEKHVGEEIAV